METVLGFYSEKRTVGMFWLNAAETWIDLSSNIADKVKRWSIQYLIMNIFSSVFFCVQFASKKSIHEKSSLGPFHESCVKTRILARYNTMLLYRLFSF